MGTNLGWDLGPIELSTAPTSTGIPLILGYDSDQRRQFGNLMAGRLRIAGGWFHREFGLAMRAILWNIWHNMVDSLDREWTTMMSWVSRLTTLFTHASRFGWTLWSIEWIG
jgi:hypothetical protein